MTKGKLGAWFLLFIFVKCLFVGQAQDNSGISILLVSYSFKNNNQRAKGVIETQKWANNKRAGGVAVIPCYWLLHVGKKEKPSQK